MLLKIPGPGGERPRARDQPRIDQIFVGDHVGGARLHVQTSGDAVGQIGEKAPVRVLENTSQQAMMGMGVDKARQQVGAADVHHLCTRRADPPARC